MVNKKISVCGYCMLHRYETFAKVVSNIRNHLNLKDLKIYAYSFRDSFSPKIKKQLESQINNFELKYIPKIIPNHISEKDLYSNKKNIDYVRKSFPKSRVNYLHMCHFMSDPSLIQDVLKYYLKIQFDDDSWFHKYPNISLDNILNDKKKEIFTGNTFSYPYEKAKKTTEQLFETVKNFCTKYDITPKNKLLRTAIKKNNEKLFYELKYASGNFNIYKTNFFTNKSWYKYILHMKEAGGMFKHRWGDHEVIGIYGYLFYKDPIEDLNLIEKGIFEHKPSFFIKDGGLIYSGFTLKNKFKIILGNIRIFLKKLLRK